MGVQAAPARGQKEGSETARLQWVGVGKRDTYYFEVLHCTFMRSMAGSRDPSNDASSRVATS
jgi:hypothetical protein